jgi:hypothetical protein
MEFIELVRGQAASLHHDIQRWESEIAAPFETTTEPVDIEVGLHGE